MARFEPEDRELLSELADLTESVGRRIRSPKNTTEDLTELRDSANYIAETLQTVRDTINARS